MSTEPKKCDAVVAGLHCRLDADHLDKGEPHVYPLYSDDTLPPDPRTMSMTNPFEVVVRNHTPYNFNTRSIITTRGSKADIIERIEVIIEPTHAVPSTGMKTIDEYDFSVRAANALHTAGIKTWGQLARKTETELKRLRNFSPHSLQEVKTALAELGLVLGMKAP